MWLHVLCICLDQSTQTGSGYSPLVKNNKESYFDKAMDFEKEISDSDDIHVTDLTIAQLNLTADATTATEELSPNVITATTAATTMHEHTTTTASLEDRVLSEGHVTSSSDGDNLTEPHPQSASHLTTPTQYLSTSLPSPNSDEWIAVQKKKKRSKDEGSAGKVYKKN